MKNVWTALIRVGRVAIAAGLPYLLTWVAGHPNPKIALLGPIINGVGKYLRDQYGWNWLPI